MPVRGAAAVTSPCYPTLAGEKLEAYAQAIRGLTTLELEPEPERRLKPPDFIDIEALREDGYTTKFGGLHFSFPFYLR